MATTWGDVKEEVRDSFRDSTTAFIDDDELARYCKRTLRLIASNYIYGFQETTGTLTLTGASSYNLATSFPDFQELWGLSYLLNGATAPGCELTYYNARDFLYAADILGYTVQGTSTLKLYVPAGGTGITGSLTVIYYSSTMLTSASGTAKEIPTLDTDVFRIPERFLSVLVEGILMFCFRKDKSLREDFTDSKEAFEKALLKMQLEEPRRVKSVQRYARSQF